ncbi:MAG: flippase [Acholeplasmatales bacterium]|nr:flippase [Acholeplasmatales bacterium]
MSNNIAKNAFLNTTKTILGILFPLVTYPYISRILGVENIGIYNYSYSFLSYFLLIGGLGVATYGIREGTQYRDDKCAIQQFVSELFSINILASFLSYLLLFILLIAIPFLSSYSSSIAILSIEIIFTTVGVSWVCNIYEDFFIIAIRTIIFQILSLVLIFLFVKSTEDLNNYLIILLISNSGANIFNFFYIRNKYCHFKFTLKIDWKRHLKPILIIFSTSIAITVYVNSDNIILGFMTNDFQVGLYGTAVKIYTVIKNILAAILMVMIPQFSLLFAQKDYKHISLFLSKVINVLTLLMLPMCVGLFCLSEEIVILISGEEYLQASLPLKFLSIAVAFSLYSYLFSQCVLIPNKQESLVFRVTFYSALLNVCLNLILIPFWGICAAALTTILAELMTVLILYHYSKLYFEFHKIKWNLLSVLIGCLCIYLVCYIMKIINSFTLKILSSIGVSIIVYILCLFFTKNKVFSNLCIILIKKMSTINKGQHL